MNTEHEVPQAQEVMTDEEMAGMDSYPYSTSKYPAQSKRGDKSPPKRSPPKRGKDSSQQDQIPVWYKWNKEKLKCFCSEPLVLCESRSEQNPGRMYFKCQKNRCKFFQWGNEMPSCKNMGWLRGSEQVGCKSPAPMYKSLYEKTLDEISESRPLLSVTGKDPLWDEVLATSIMVVDSTMRLSALQKLKRVSVHSV
ncbi:hypothetical protein OS493_036570 [Desmophyllum pertusum]|uniref:GRF-type domain-containing protein n=1 Tax=Desmophyllum pertusum TaxID=174260 RepID=A0A9W9Y8T2_9CNID|nr:hypothetical protein OS493_036570 [Desmophyllum pertusum]